ncbi:MAG: TRAP transporter large permease subunit [Desulfobacterales bacterium]|nr:TRAP transporter large permease subunit [Desulfobacterales bacterium]
MKVESFGQFSLRVTKSVSNIGVFALGFFMLLTAADVIGRYFLNSPLTGAIEIVGLALLVLIVAVIPYIGAMNRHITIDFLLNAVSERKRLIINSVVTTVSLFLVGVIIWRTVVYGFFLLKSNQTTSVLGIPLFPFVFILALGFALYWLVLLSDLVRYVSQGTVSAAQVWKWVAVGIAILVVLYFLSAWPIRPIWRLSPLTTGLIGMAVLFAAFIAGLPIFSTLLLVGFLGICYLRGFNAGLSVMGSSPFTVSSHYDFSTIPLFVLMGEICFFSGIGKDLYQAAYKWAGALPGGLAIATIGACGGFAAVCGDSLATAITMGTIAIPEMKRYKYSAGLASATVAAGGTLGVLIPPSLAFLLYALLTDQSIATLFIAGILPGIVLILLFVASIYFRAWKDPSLAPAGPKTSWNEKFYSLKGVWATLLLFALVVIGMYAGIFAPTEGGGFGAFGALVIGLARRRLNWAGIRSSLEEAAKISGICMSILIGANIFGYFLAASKLPMEMAQFVSQLDVWPTAILAMILIIYLILGCLMPAIPMLILTVPIFYPVITTLGYDPIWYGVIMVLMFEMAVITPPMGINVLALHSIDRETSLAAMFKGISWYLIVMVFFIVLLIVFPGIALILPQIFSRM